MNFQKLILPTFKSGRGLEIQRIAREERTSKTRGFSLEVHRRGTRRQPKNNRKNSVEFMAVNAARNRPTKLHDRKHLLPRPARTGPDLRRRNPNFLVEKPQIRISSRQLLPGPAQRDL